MKISRVKTSTDFSGSESVEKDLVKLENHLVPVW